MSLVQTAVAEQTKYAYQYIYSKGINLLKRPEVLYSDIIDDYTYIYGTHLVRGNRLSVRDGYTI